MPVTGLLKTLLVAVPLLVLSGCATSPATTADEPTSTTSAGNPFAAAPVASSAEDNPFASKPSDRHAAILFGDAAPATPRPAHHTDANAYAPIVQVAARTPAATTPAEVMPTETTPVETSPAETALTETTPPPMRVARTTSAANPFADTAATHTIEATAFAPLARPLEAPAPVPTPPVPDPAPTPAAPAPIPASAPESAPAPTLPVATETAAADDNPFVRKPSSVHAAVLFGDSQPSDAPRASDRERTRNGFAPARPVPETPTQTVAESAHPPLLQSDGAITAVGPGDTLELTVFGQPDLSSRITVTADGEITVPFLGHLRVAGESPSAIARRVEAGLQRGGYLRDPQVSIEVTQIRSRVVSILGEVGQSGRYPIEGRLSLLELLAMAGGLKDAASDTIVLMRRTADAQTGESRIEIPIGNRSIPSPAVENLMLQAGDVVYVPMAQRFFVYGEVNQPGAYPVERGMNVMRAVSLAGGLSNRASDRRILIQRPDETTDKITSIQADLGDEIRPGDVILVKERWF